MCLSDLGPVISVDPAGHSAVVELAGNHRTISTIVIDLDGTPPAVGDWLIVQTGLAVTRLEPDEAAAILAARAPLEGNT